MDTYDFYTHQLERHNENASKMRSHYNQLIELAKILNESILLTFDFQEDYKLPRYRV